MKYSKIKTLRVKNFRCIGDVTIDFTESPIVCLKADNECGKTSIIKSMAVLGANAYARDQKDYIRDGTAGFGIAVDMEDGTLATRVKTAAINGCSVEKPGEEPWSTKTIDGTGVPVQMAEVMGFVEEEETKEILHIRTYEDNLLFVFTNSSTNYKVMYHVLKVGQLTKAIKLGSDEVNALKAAINTNSISIKTLIENIKRIKVVDTEPVSNVKERLKIQYEILDKASRAVDCLDRIELIESRIGASIELQNISEIDALTCSKLDNVKRMILGIKEAEERLCRYAGSENLQKIEVRTITNMVSAIEKISSIQRQREVIKGLEGIQELVSINVELCSKVSKLKGTFERADESARRLLGYNFGGADYVTQLQLEVTEKAGKCLEYMDKISRLSKGIEEDNKEIEEYNKLIKESGAIVTECSRCGNDVVVDARIYIQ